MEVVKAHLKLIKSSLATQYEFVELHLKTSNS